MKANLTKFELFQFHNASMATFVNKANINFHYCEHFLQFSENNKFYTMSQN